jgi:hypothetical protein
MVGVKSYPARNTLIGMDSPLTGAPSMISYLKERGPEIKTFNNQCLFKIKCKYCTK